MGGHLSPLYGQVIVVSGYPVLTAVNWSQNWCAICVQYQFSCAPKLARKCEIEHWYACGADGRLIVRSVYGHVITKFPGMGRFTYHSAPLARASRARAPLWRIMKISEGDIRRGWHPTRSLQFFRWHEAEFNNCRFVIFLKKVYEKVRMLRT